MSVKEFGVGFREMKKAIAIMVLGLLAGGASPGDSTKRYVADYQDFQRQVWKC
tara:strand:+ start:222 stop:380 length:159 start_codon:yes stop_codon:yes gene_type:complete